MSIVPISVSDILYEVSVRELCSPSGMRSLATPSLRRGQRP